jgi:2-keto-3-deoxy-L-rhamnonate aldolase RhmA
MTGFHRLLNEKDAAFGMFVSFADPAAVEIAKHAGFDFIRIDLEHKLLGAHELREMVRTATLLNLPVQVRVPRLADITALLDAGVSNVLIPGIACAAQARDAVTESKYFPLGRRGISGDARCVRFGHDGLLPYLFEANDRHVTLGIQIEQREAVENIDDILAVEGIDIVVTGRNDLSQSYGHLGNSTHEDVLQTEALIIRRAINAGKQPMILARDAARVSELRAMGVRLFMVASDHSLLYRSLKGALAAVKG